MKKYLGFLFILFSFLLIGALAAFAQTPPPSPTPLAPGDVINGVLGVATSWKAGGVWLGISALLNFLINILKTGTFKNFFSKILPDKFQATFVLVLGLAVVVIGSLASGGTFVSGLILGVQSSAGAVLFHEILQDYFNTPAGPVAQAPASAAPPAAS